MILESIQSPADLKKIPRDSLPALAEELRSVIIGQVSCDGGHLASNLGVVELTLALHYVFDAPRDKIIWDVGHQSYTHKIITGRSDRFSTLRKYRGLSGFPRMTESPYDAFGTGHSSTSISAALGIREACDKKGDRCKVIPVIGDGAISSGLAFEGLNHAGQLGKDLLVILNDNEMSISKNVGALSAYLNRLLTGEAFQKFKKETRSFIEHIPKLGIPVSKIAQRLEESLKGFLLPGILFEELGFNYVGPIDGHDIDLLIETLLRIRYAEEPVLMHVITRKGKGYPFSEKDPCNFHGVGPFDPTTGMVAMPDSALPSYSDVFGQTLVELASQDNRIIAISAAMREGTGLCDFSLAHPDRFYDVGIAEQHAVTFAAGLASQGYKPVVAVYSTFLQRAYDQIVHDVCLQKLPVVFAIDRSGLVGEDGATHQGLFDLSYLGHIPNLVVMAPKDGDELSSMLATAVTHTGPAAIRYPRGKVPLPVRPAAQDSGLRIGRAEMLTDGSDIAILAVGSTVYPSLRAGTRLRREGISPCVINARFVKPLDEDMIRAVAGRIRRLVTVEENVLAGGFGAAVLECLNRAGMHDVIVKRIGIDDVFVEHGSLNTLRAAYSLDEEGIYRSCKSCLADLPLLYEGHH